MNYQKVYELPKIGTFKQIAERVFNIAVYTNQTRSLPLQTLTEFEASDSTLTSSDIISSVS